MNRSILPVAAVAALAFCSAAAHAETKLNEEKLLDACVHQYIADNLADYQGKVTVNKLTGGYHPSVASAKKQIKVTAVHRLSGEHLGTVICNVAKDGKVTVAALDAFAAAKLYNLIKAPVIAHNAE